MKMRDAEPAGDGEPATGEGSPAARGGRHERTEDELPEWRRRTPFPAGSTSGGYKLDSNRSPRPLQHPHKQQQGSGLRPAWRQRDQQRPAFVPIKSWRSCRQVAAEMEALPAERLDQRLLSGAMQHMVTLHDAAPLGSDQTCCARLLDLARPLLDSFDAFGLCIVVRTAARLGTRLGSEYLLAWCQAAERRLNSFNPQDLANSVFSIGVSGQCLAGTTLPAFCAAIQRLAARMNAQEQANTLLGLAYMLRCSACTPPGQGGQRGMEAAAEAVLQARWPPRSAFKHQELANLAWAFSKLTSCDAWRRCEAPLWELFSEAADRAFSLPPQELSNLCLAMANTTLFHPQALSRLVAAAAACARRLDEQHLDNILLSAATLPRWVSAAGAAAQAEERLPCVHPEHVAALREELLRRLLRADRSSGVAGRDPTASGICRAVWGLAMLQACTVEVWHAAVAALQLLQEGGTPEEDLDFFQLGYAHLQLAAEGLHIELPPTLQERIRRAQERLGGSIIVSQLQRDVSVALRAAGVDHSVEFTPEGSYRSIDIALPEERIAVEVDGPRHFTVNRVHGRHWRLGATSARDRLLRALGWRVIAVDFHDWRRLPGDSAARQCWLRARLAAVRVEEAAVAGGDGGGGSIEGRLAGTSL